MMASWAVGDLAICVYEGKYGRLSDRTTGHDGPRRGQIYTVARVSEMDGLYNDKLLMLSFDEISGKRFHCKSFRKIEPLEEAAASSREEVL